MGLIVQQLTQSSLVRLVTVCFDGEHAEQNMNSWSLSAVALHAPAKHLELQRIHVAFAEHSREISFA